MFSSKEINTFKEANRYFKYRNDYPNNETILSIQGKLEGVVRFKSFNEVELKYMKKIVDENIKHVTKVEYPGLSQDFVNTRKQEILELLFGLRKKIVKFINM